MMERLHVLVMIPCEARHGEILKAAGAECIFRFKGAEALRDARGLIGGQAFGELLDEGPVTEEDAAWADVILGNPTPELLKSAGRLQWLQTNSAGVEAYLRPGVLPENTLLTNATGAYGPAISEHMLGMLLALMKKLELYRDAQRAERWGSQGAVTSLSGATVLILGMGDIGGEFGKRCKAMGAKVIGVRRTPRALPDYADEVHTLEQLDELLPLADVVAVTLPGTEETGNLLDRERLERMKPGAYLLNTGRGNIVNTEALCDALESGRLAGAGLDVTEPEPLPAGHRLWGIPTALITPHVSGFYHLRETHERIVRICADNLRRFLKGQPLKNQVDFAAGYRKLPEEKQIQEHYLDNSATTRVLPEAAQKAVEMMTEEYGNPSSLHNRGFHARQELERARAVVAARLGAQPEEVIFTSGGTEGNNIAIFGAAEAGKRRGNKIVTTAVEHDSVLNAVAQLEKQGFEAVYLRPDERGRISEEQIMEAVDEETVLVTMMLVNNETGAIFPVEAAARAIRRKRAPALLHVDAVQAFGKLDFSPKKLGADLVTVSAHKLHGPKGAGALYVRKGVRITPRAFGGGQEKNLRSGTESVPLLCAFGEAVKRLPRAAETLPEIEALNSALRAGLAALPEVTVNSPEDALPYILNFSAGTVRAETMLHFLSERGISVSSGSACGRAKPSHVLEAMGLPKERISSALRVSFSRFSTEEDVRALLSGLKEGLGSLQRE